MRVTESIPLPTEPVKSDPFNYVVNAHLHHHRWSSAELLAEVMQAFPFLSSAEGQSIVQQIEPLQNLAAELASQVNRKKMSQQSAVEQIKQQFPQIDYGNTASVMMQNLIDTR